MLDTIRQAWGWIGLEPAEVVASNPFGNLIVRAIDGAFWRICPEELSCNRIAANATELAALFAEEDFQLDWQMSRLVELANHKLGPLPEGTCYCLMRPAVLGGSYDEENFGTISVQELLSFSGDLAEKIKDLPDGATVQFKIVP